MFHSLTSRKRRIAITTTVAVVFLVAAAALVSLALAPEDEYKPGEDLEGLTADLARDLPSDYPRVTFSDATQSAGITFRHFWGKRSTQLPEDMGSGAAWGDYDNDGWIDLFVVNEIGSLEMSDETRAESPARSVLYHNNGDGTFSDVTGAAGIDHRTIGMAVAWADYDNDGWLDLFMTSFGHNVLFHNNGDGTFTDRTVAAGMEVQHGFWTGASWGDFNRDGFIDLYVSAYVQYEKHDRATTALQYDVDVPTSINPSSFEPARNLLYRNNGDGSFSEVSEVAGVSGKAGRSLAAVWSDFDSDGWPDLYVANDVSDNVLFRNRGDGTFDEISNEAWVADYRGAMGLAVGDWDGDTDQDIFVTHWIAQENALYNNLLTEFMAVENPPDNPIHFSDQADRFGLGQIALDYVGWGTSFIDYDNDGRLDLFVVNGSTFQQSDDPTSLVPMEDQLFWNRSNEDGFFDVSLLSGEYFGTKLVGRGAAFGDYDNDGDIDAFIVNNHWLEVRLVGRTSNRSAIGAHIRLVAGSEVKVREIGAQSSYLSQNSLTAHFGMGTHSVADSLEIRWPSGTRQVMTAVKANQILQITEDAGSN